MGGSSKYIIEMGVPTTNRGEKKKNPRRRGGGGPKELLKKRSRLLRGANSVPSDHENSLEKHRTKLGGGIVPLQPRTTLLVLER